jgi:hypothetical protein
MNRAGLIESQHWSPDVEEAGHVANRVSNYENYIGTNSQDRLPMRRGFASMFGRHEHVPAGLAKLNQYATRYHAPGGLEYRKMDLYGMNTSSPKPLGRNFINQQIQVNREPGPNHL